MQTDFDKELALFFTDVEYLRDEFENNLATPTLTKHMLIIHGIGGVGKSSLLRMFRLHCKTVGIPVALASGDETKSIVEVLYFKNQVGEERGWVPDLKANGVRFPKFDATFGHYRSIQTKVDKQVKKASGRAADILGKAASKTAEAAGGALAGAVIGSAFPGIGTAIGGALGSVLGGASGDVLKDWLGGFLKEQEIDLLLDPAKRLTKDFLDDLTKAADKRRMVLMLDTFEQMTALEDWMRDVTQRLHNTDVLFVIAGRELPDWSRAWPGWMANAQVEELKPMDEEVMHDLVRRYYATMRGGEPDPNQVEAIIRFARGLPIVVTSLVRLWVKYPDSLGDIQIVKPEVMPDLVDRLIEGVPDTLVPMLEAAAVVRWFDEPILRVVTGQADVREFYDELRKFPFVRPRSKGLALHDAVREIIEENLHIQDAERHKSLHKRAAAYFENQLGNMENKETEQLELERLYHYIRADEETGIQLFLGMAETLSQYRLANRFRALMNDVITYPIERLNNRLWRDYYMAILFGLEGRWFLAEELFINIANNQDAPDSVKSYALVRWGTYLARPERLSQPGGVDKAIQVLNLSIIKSGSYDAQTIDNLWELGIIYERLCQWEKAWQYFNEIRRYAESLGRNYQTARLFSLLKDPYAKTGDWRELISLQKELSALLDELDISSAIKANNLANWAIGFTWMGRYRDAELILRDVIESSTQFDTDTSVYRRELGITIGLQDRFQEGHSEFQKGFAESKERVKRRANFDLDRAVLLHYSFWATVHLRAGELSQARRKFLVAVWLKRKHKDLIGFPELFVGLGLVYELLSEFSHAQRWYLRCIELKSAGRRYFECGALTGLARIKRVQEEHDSIQHLLFDAEQLAQKYEYNDHLASLRLTQGHIAWEGKAPSWENGFDAALRLYQYALIYALRYNRFLLDEVLSGRPQGTPLRPIIPYCRERSEEGKRMLTALLDWWKTGLNDIGTPRPDTISPIPEGIPLLEAECIAREREPGDGSPQTSVVEQIAAALSMLGA